jgi:hypothetical protein
MKYLITILFFYSQIVNAQKICVAADCKDSVRLPMDSMSLNAVVTPNIASTTIWRLVSGSATSISGATSKTAMAHGLQAGLNVFQVTAQTPTMTTQALDTIVGLPPCPICPPPVICPVCPPVIVCPVCPAPIKQRTAVGITLDLISNKKTITYDDGSKTVL